MTSSSPSDKTASLDGLRVLEVAGMVAGPFCGKLLACLGADVIKAEPPGRGDPARRRGPFPGDIPHPERSGLFLYLNSNKRSITLNLEDPQGRALLEELVAQVDVVIHDLGPSLAHTMGLVHESLANSNPQLIVAAVTAFGRSGPYADYKARHINIFHSGGEGYLLPNGLALDTFPHRAPVAAGSNMSDYQGGLTAALGILAAVYARRAGASGQEIDCSMQEAQLAIGYLPMQRLESEGVVEDRFSRFFRVGGVLPAQDGYVELLTLEPRQWQGLSALLGDPDWAAPEHFQEPAKHGPEINQGLREWAKTHTKAWLYEQGQAYGVPIAPYFTPAEVFHSRQQRDRGFFVPVDHPAAGCYEYASLPFRLGENPERLDRAPLLGEHNRETYQQLGYSPLDIADLGRAGAI